MTYPFWKWCTSAALATDSAETKTQMLLKNKLAVVTGANRGIGADILDLFTEHGANVIACARHETEAFRLKCTALENAYGVTVHPLYFDLSSSETIKKAVNEIVSLRRQVDILVNNAGIGSGSLFQMTSLQELHRVFEVNFFGQVQFTQSISRLMCRQKSGSIINMASTAGLLGEPGMTAYGASKAALILATRTLAAEVGSNGVRVNAIAPSVTHTDMYEQMEAGARERLIQSSALKRAAQPREIANVALFLASELSTYVTGQVVRVDGGII